MYRIRFHGRGGQGMKTSSRILGTSFFNEGLEVQDAPRYGAERRGAPVFAYVRADRKIINERGFIHTPDLIVVADESLVHATPGILFEGISPNTVILINTGKRAETLAELIPSCRKIISFSAEENNTIKDIEQNHFLSSICASASAGLTDVISWHSVESAITAELPRINSSVIIRNIEIAHKVFLSMAQYKGIVIEAADTSDTDVTAPGWIDIPLHSSVTASPSIRNTGSSVRNSTGSWRTFRPEVNKDICSRCMLCNLCCPDNAIICGSEGFPEIDYSHCKGCLICASVCPVKAIGITREHSAACNGGEDDTKNAHR